MMRVRCLRIPVALLSLGACGGARGDVASLGPASACDAQTHACALRVEEAQAERYPGRVRREGGELVLRIGDARGLGFADSPPGTEPSAWRRFTFHDYLPGPGLYVLRVHYVNGSDFLLVEDRSGTQHRAEGPPVVSPDGARFATVGPAPAGSGSVLTVWRTQPGAVEPEWRAAPAPGEEPWTLRAPVWLDAGTLRVIRVFGDDDALSEREEVLLLRRGADGGWQAEG